MVIVVASAGRHSDLEPSRVELGEGERETIGVSEGVSVN